MDTIAVFNKFTLFIFVSFQGKTTVKKNSYNPIWNEELIFTEMFPPLCQRIKVKMNKKRQPAEQNSTFVPFRLMSVVNAC